MNSPDEEYGEDYFENGEEKQLSCYSDYRWLATRTLVTASDIIRRANIEKNDIILDYGCAKGFLVKAMRHLGYESYGCDISSYALKNADKEVKKYLFNVNDKSWNNFKEYDVVICKDTAEHIPYEKINDFLKEIKLMARKKVIIIVPLGDGKKYNIPRYELDVTHKIRESLGWWVKKVEDCGFEVIVVTDNLKDIKPNWNTPLANLYIEAIPK